MKIPTAVTINNTVLPVKEWNGQRVVTLKDIDTVHGRPNDTARRNFNKNKKHLIEGVDFFKVCSDEIRTHKMNGISPKAHGNILLITETGYLMLVKSFTDDLAWDVQRQLVNSYFTVQHFMHQVPPEPTKITDEEIQRIVERAKERRDMEALAKYHFLKAGVLIKQAEYEMKQGELFQLMRSHPWLAESDHLLRMEENI